MINMLRMPTEMRNTTTEVDESEVQHVDQRVADDETIYSGQMKIVFQDGNEKWVKHGTGTQQWPDMSKYVGDWRDDQATGRG